MSCLSLEKVPKSVLIFFSARSKNCPLPVTNNKTKIVTQKTSLNFKQWTFNFLCALRSKLGRDRRKEEKRVLSSAQTRSETCFVCRVNFFLEIWLILKIFRFQDPLLGYNALEKR